MPRLRRSTVRPVGNRNAPGKGKKAGGPGKRKKTQSRNDAASSAPKGQGRGAPKRQPKLSKRQSERLQRQERKIVAFFRTAGIESMLAADGYLYVNKKPTFRWGRPIDLKVVDWNGLIDKLAVATCSREFIAMLGEQGDVLGESIRAFYVRQSSGFELRRGNDALALVCASQTHVYGGGKIVGNFLTPGPHWSDMRAAIDRSELGLSSEPPPRVTEAPPAARAATVLELVSLDDVEVELGPEIIDACLEASRRIRIERQMAYGHTVVMESDLGNLTLRPITTRNDKPIAPFSFSRNLTDIAGEVVLSSESDPLPVRLQPVDLASIRATAWAAVLIGMADATCFKLGQTPRPSGLRSGLLHSTTTSRGQVLRDAPVAGHRIWPAHLEPIGHWHPHSSSFVAGHRRHFNDGSTASAEARERARRLGILLGPNETWVQPHVRGMPDGVEMRFRWHPPDELDRLRSAR